MIVIRYGDSLPVEDVYEEYNYIKQVLPDERILMLPYDWDILFNCTTAELYSFIEQIKELIREKEILNED